MAANPISIVERKHAVAYDGTNSGDIDALFPLTTISEAGGVWTFESPPAGPTYVVNTNDWIVFYQGYVFGTFSPTAFDMFFRCNAECDDIQANDIQALQEAVEILETQVSDLESDVENLGGESVRSVGVAPVPSLLLLTSANVDVQLSPAMPDTSFTARAYKFAGVSLSDLVINSVTIIDQDTVRVNVGNTGALTITGASLLVTASA